MLNIIKSCVRWVTCRNLEPIQIEIPHAIQIEEDPVDTRTQLHHLVQDWYLEALRGNRPLQREQLVARANQLLLNIRIQREQQSAHTNQLLAEISAESEQVPLSQPSLEQTPPLKQLKDAIVGSRKKQAYIIMNETSDAELEEALLYLENINANTPKNKTRPIIRNAIKKMLRERRVEKRK